MKFYEFEKGLGYYALIGAENIEDAKWAYTEHICELEPEEQAEPKEISEEDAFRKSIHACENNKEKRQESRYFRNRIKDTEPFVVLIDKFLFY